VSRVVFGKNAEPEKWFRLDTLLQDIAAHQSPDPSIMPGGPAIDPQNSVSGRSGVAALSLQPDIFNFDTEATASGHVAFASSTTSELLGALVARADF
jgi:hypothetical protein